MPDEAPTPPVPPAKVVHDALACADSLDDLVPCVDGEPYPVTCDFCGRKTDSAHAQPEEADTWACDPCWDKFRLEEVKRFPNV